MTGSVVHQASMKMNTIKHTAESGRGHRRILGEARLERSRTTEPDYDGLARIIGLRI